MKYPINFRVCRSRIQQTLDDMDTSNTHFLWAHPPCSSTFNDSATPLRFPPHQNLTTQSTRPPSLLSLSPHRRRGRWLGVCTPTCASCCTCKRRGAARVERARHDVLQSSYGSGRQPKYLSVRRLIGRSDRKILWPLSLVQKWDGKDG